MTKLLRAVIALAIVITIQNTAASQSLSINADGSTACLCVLLDVKSMSKCRLSPRISKADKNAIISSAAGLMVFQNALDSVDFYYYSGCSRLWLSAA